MEEIKDAASSPGEPSLSQQLALVIDAARQDAISSPVPCDQKLLLRFALALEQCLEGKYVKQSFLKIDEEEPSKADAGEPDVEDSPSTSSSPPMEPQVPSPDESRRTPPAKLGRTLSKRNPIFISKESLVSRDGSAPKASENLKINPVSHSNSANDRKNSRLTPSSIASDSQAEAAPEATPAQEQPTSEEEPEQKIIQKIKVHRERSSSDSHVKTRAKIFEADIIKRRHILQEMLQTEQNYERDLGVVADVFVNPLKEQSVIDKELLDRIFPPSLLSLRELSKWHVSELTKLIAQEKDNNVLVGAHFSQLAEKVRSYDEYILRYEEGRITLAATISSTPAFAKFLKGQGKHANCRFFLAYRIGLKRKKFLTLDTSGVLSINTTSISPDVAKSAEKDPQCSNHSLEDYLISVVQHVPRYVLLLNDLQQHTKSDHPDFAPIGDALNRMRNATQYINDRKKLFEKARDATQWVKLFGIQSKITCYMELTEDASTELKDDSVNSCKIVALSEALYVVKTDAEGQGVVDSEKRFSWKAVHISGMDEPRALKIDKKVYYFKNGKARDRVLQRLKEIQHKLEQLASVTHIHHIDASAALDVQRRSFGSDRILFTVHLAADLKKSVFASRDTSLREILEPICVARGLDLLRCEARYMNGDLINDLAITLQRLGYSEITFKPHAGA